MKCGTSVKYSFSCRQKTAERFLVVINLKNKGNKEFYGLVPKFHVDYKIFLYQLKS
jgi:hypothetical protein